MELLFSDSAKRVARLPFPSPITLARRPPRNSKAFATAGVPRCGRLLASCLWGVNDRTARVEKIPSFSRPKHSPSLSRPVLQQPIHPLKLWMQAQKLFRHKRHPARRSPPRRKRHFLGHRPIHSLAIYRPAAIKGNTLAARFWVTLEMPAQRPSARKHLSTVRVEMVRLELLGQLNVNPALVLLHQLLPPHPPGHRRQPDVHVIAFRL